MCKLNRVGPGQGQVMIGNEVGDFVSQIVLVQLEVSRVVTEFSYYLAESN